jgi:pimeloyl-ACP methyl ester carboxylesterase
MGEDVQTWEAVQKSLSHWTTFSYDRPGLGQSEPTPAPRDGETLARELHELLGALKLPPPYVLVGHSLGGAIVQIFANFYPREMKALVLLDPEDGRLIEQVRKQLSKEEWDQRAAAISRYVKLAPEQQREMDASGATGDEVAKIRNLPDIPIVLFTGTLLNPEFPGNVVEQKAKFELHRQLMLANPQTKQVLVPESRHYIHVDKPDVVIAEIKTLAQQN